MPKKKTLIWFTLGIIFVVFLAFIFFIKSFGTYSYATIAPRAEYSKSTSPVRLEIPSIGVNANIISLGLGQGGKMDNPKKSMDTGWYNLGPAPGDQGSAVIAGHRGWKIGPAVFDHLDKVNVGDEVKVVTKEGKELIFKVREKRIYNAEDKIPEVWIGGSGSHLNIITCSGKRNIFTGSSEDRLVVFTDLVI